MAKKNKAVTASDVAREAGVSQATVSMILNNSPYASFSEETRKKVFAACVTTGYKGASAQSTVSPDNTILLVCPSCENTDYARAIVAIQQRANELGYTAFALNTLRIERLENDVLRYLRTMPLCGAIFLYQPRNAYLLAQADKLRPTVTVCDRINTLELDTIELNSFKVGKAIATHLLDLGHENIVYVAMETDEQHITRVKRLEGIKDTYKAFGMDPDKYVRVCTYATENIRMKKYSYEYEAGYVLAGRALEKYDFTAFVGNNDMTCYGIIDALQNKRLRIPQDYSVCGCDNLQLSGTKPISLTTVEHYSRQRATDAVDMLIKKINLANNSQFIDAPVSITRVEYEPKIICRASTGVPRRRK